MNVTNKPFDQLKIMRNRLTNQRRIKDCYKLLRHPLIIHQACQQLTFSDQAIQSVSAKLSGTIDTPLRFTQLTSTDDAILRETCLFLLQELFIAQQFLNKENQSTGALLQQFSRQFQAVNWVLSIEILKDDWSGLRNCLELFIDDLRFNHLLFYVLEKLQQQDYPRFKKISRGLYFSLQLLTIPKPNFDCHVIYEHNRLHLGLSSTKEQARSLYNKLYSRLNKEVHCYFTHFSQPLLYQGYAVKRDWKSNKICIEVPQQALIKQSALFQYGDFHNQYSRGRGVLVHQPIPEIYSIYQAEVKQVAFDYRYADNYRVLGQWVHFAQLSLVKTVALKQGCTIGQANYLLKARGFKRLTLPRRRLF